MWEENRTPEEIKHIKIINTILIISGLIILAITLIFILKDNFKTNKELSTLQPVEHITVLDITNNQEK